MGYVMDIRRKIGHDPLMIVGGSVLVVNPQGQILLQRRRDDGKWGYHGGSLDLHERTEDAARRELFEETGLTARKLTLLGVFSGPEMDHVYPNGDQASIVDVVYVCRDYEGELKPQTDEVTELRWFDPQSLPEQLTPVNRWVLEAFLRSLAEGQG